MEQTPWRNWIAHWTSNPEVAGSNPVGVASREIDQIDILSLSLCGSVPQLIEIASAASVVPRGLALVHYGGY